MSAIPQEAWEESGGFFLAYDLLTEEERRARKPDVRDFPQPAPGEYPRNFSEFMGQDEAVTLLRTEVEAAKRESRPLAHILLYGPPGCGKTGLAHVLAGEMGYALYESTGAEYASQQSMLDALLSIARLQDSTGRPTLWLIDEIDGMGRAASYTIHSLMTHQYVVWRGQRYGPSFPVVVCGTTNRMAGVPRALKSRFHEHVAVDYYDVPELEVIAKHSALRMEMLLTDEAAAFLAENSGGEPRKLIRRLLRNLRNLVPGRFATADMAAAGRALGLSGLRHRGLSQPQFRYLEVLEGAEANTAGLNTIAGATGQDPKDLQFEHEPFLLRSGLVAVTRGGRRLTEAGRICLAEARPQP